jgi:hypothetical protein
MRNAYKILVEETERKTQLGRLVEDLKETGCENTDWIHLAQDKIQWRDILNTL